MKESSMISWEQVRGAVYRMRRFGATVEDYLLYLRFELEQAMNSLPPEKKDNESDGFHAGCCTLRAYSALLQLEDFMKRRDLMNQHVKDIPTL